MLTKIKKRKYIQQVVLKGNRDALAWGLTDKGFRAIACDLPALEKKAYKPANPFHDFLCSALHIGNWVGGAPECVEVFSEQELKTYHPDYHPDWLPEITDHRPDGYWHFKRPDGLNTFALEVETTQKAKSRYEKVQYAYESTPEISKVIWAVPSTPSAKTILYKMTEDGTTENKKHNFLLIKDVMKKNWESKFILGPFEGLTLSYVMDNMSLKSHPGAILGPNSKVLINTRIYAANSDTYLKRRNSKFID